MSGVHTGPSPDAVHTDAWPTSERARERVNETMAPLVDLDPQASLTRAGAAKLLDGVLLN
ncbi:hypothetical protein G5B47_22130 [Paenibacillus sp. 7124]|uniref:Uncharacterized protein n=1 Tax=Paenibacillus apii TaxID=1850370 RepID=A0A6M1PRV7_9BACL|nr:hypothetical protein [Paenibacillus apii]NGM85104.1 hypothetical protein [Paenibacillus apii]